MSDREITREAVIEAFESYLAQRVYINHPHPDVIRAAVEMLKEREPRVIGISEIYTAKKIDVWIEDKSESIVHPLMLIETEMTNKSQTVFFYPMLGRPIKAYGKTWRCWTARPTDEQREAVKWDG